MLLRLAMLASVVASAAVPTSATITAAPVPLGDLAKRQTATYAGTCTYYTGALLGGYITSSCNDAAVPGPFASQTCAVLDILVLGNVNCGSIQTATTCTATSGLYSSVYLSYGGFLGLVGYWKTTVITTTTSACAAPTFMTRPAVAVVTTTSKTSTTSSTTTATTSSPVLSPIKTSVRATTSSSTTSTITTSSAIASSTSSATPASASLTTSSGTLTTSSFSSFALVSTSSSTASTSSTRLPTSSSASSSFFGSSSSSSSSTITPSLLSSSKSTSSSSIVFTSVASSQPSISPPSFISSAQTASSVNLLTTTGTPSKTSVSVIAKPTGGLPRLTQNDAKYLGCFLDNENQRTLPVRMADIGTVEACITQCQSSGFTLAGLEYYYQCFCGYTGTNGQPQIDDVSCNMACNDDSTETCGGGNALQLYSVPAPTTTSLPTATATAGLPRLTKNGGQYIGCFKDSVNQRALPVRLSDVGTVEACLEQCQSAGYTMAGLEYYYQCFCGNEGTNGQPQIDDSLCNTPCNDDKSETCGGGDAVQIYSMRPSVPSTTTSPAPTAGLPRLSRNGGKYLGCFRDDINQRALPVRLQDVGTIEACITLCQASGYALAGVEYQYQCFCGTSGTNGQPKIDDSMCKMPCNDDAAETCGGGNAVQLYSVPPGGNAPTIPTSVSTTAGSGALQGCYSDNVNYRTLPNQVADVGSVEQCVSNCIKAGYPLAGVEYTRECYCGNAARSLLIDNAHCQKYTCTENGSQKCGGDSAIQVYAVKSADAIPAATGTWSSVGCLQDFYPNPRTLQGYSFTSNSMTPQLCMSTCQAQGFTYAGVEYSGECYCDNSVRNSPRMQTSCTMSCSGDARQLCGGSNAIQVYTLGAVPSSADVAPSGAIAAAATSAVILQTTKGGATFKGCYTDSVNARALRNRIADVTDSDPVSSCMKACKSAGYLLGGVEYGHECFCGSSISNGQTATSESACSQVCDGNSQQYCGQGNIVQVYSL